MQDITALKQMGERIDNGNKKEVDLGAVFFGGRWYGFPQAGENVGVYDLRMNGGRPFVVPGDEIKAREIVIGEDPETKEPIIKRTQFPVDADGNLTVPNLVEAPAETPKSEGEQSSSETPAPEKKDEVQNQVSDGGDQGAGEGNAEGAAGGETKTPEGAGNAAS